MSASPFNTSNDRQTLPCGRPSLHVEVPTKAQGWKAKLETFIKAQGLKQSQQRFKLTEIILSQKGHFDIQDLVSRVKKRLPKMGTATVYRNVKLLCQAGILHESLRDENDRAIYEIADSGHHDHIVCLDCKEIFEFHDNKMESLQDKAATALGFQPVKHRHVIYAHCAYLHSKRKSL